MQSVLRLIHKCEDSHPERITDLKQYENDLNFKGIDFPLKAKDIKQFEKQNPNIPGINVLSINDRNEIYTLTLTEKDNQNSIDLFLYGKDRKYHYSLIKTFSRLVSSQVSSDTRKKFYCKKMFI